MSIKFPKIPKHIKGLSPEEAWMQGYNAGYGARSIEEIEKKAKEIPKFKYM